jgi:hypothetical protein
MRPIVLSPLVLALIPILVSADEPPSDVEARRKVLRDLTTAARQLDKPCPLAVVEAMLDKEDFVRWEASNCAHLFKTFEPGCAEVLLRGADADNPNVRDFCLLLLARVAPKDNKALAAMQKAKKDPDFDVRHTAHCALFIATDKFDDFVHYLMRVREDPDSLFEPQKEGSEEWKLQRMRRNLILLGSWTKWVEWSDQRPVELAEVLLKLSDDPAPAMRRGAANLIGAVAVKVKLPESEPTKPGFGTDSQLFSLIDPESAKSGEKPKEPPERSRTFAPLEKGKADERLRRLRDKDPDQSVREAARLALERWASVSEKKP